MDKWILEFQGRHIPWEPWYQDASNRFGIRYAMIEMQEMKRLFPAYDFRLRHVETKQILPLDLL